MDSNGNTKNPSIFDLIKRITVTKDKWKDIPEKEKEVFNNWMCNRILSMDENYCVAVNFVQKNTWNMKGEHLYNIYKDIIPKKYIFLKYIKSTKKKEYNDSEVEAIKNYFEISKKEAKEYINSMSEDQIKEILSYYGK